MNSFDMFSCLECFLHRVFIFPTDYHGLTRIFALALLVLAFGMFALISHRLHRLAQKRTRFACAFPPGCVFLPTDYHGLTRIFALASLVLAFGMFALLFPRYGYRPRPAT